MARRSIRALMPSESSLSRMEAPAWSSGHSSVDRPSRANPFHAVRSPGTRFVVFEEATCFRCVCGGTVGGARAIIVSAQGVVVRRLAADSAGGLTARGRDIGESGGASAGQAAGAASTPHADGVKPSGVCPTPCHALDRERGLSAGTPFEPRARDVALS
jgi:hypothetical protein